MKDFFKDIFEYHHQFNQKLADQILEHLDRIPEDSQKLFSHVLNAHQIWNSRILLQQPAFKVWDMQPPQQYKQIDLQNYGDTLRILEQADFSAPITYTNSQGQVFTNTVRDILFHVNNHSTHHKAQLASRFKALDIKPLVTDYIFFRR
jgi:uncharacterized damage-inducible protein DinB